MPGTAEALAGARLPPVRRRGPWAWARANLFATVPSTIATVVFAATLARALPRIARWAVTGAVWSADYDACRQLAYRAACWGFVAEKHRLILFGRYPYPEQWRPLVGTLLVVAALGASAHPRCWRRWLVAVWAVVLPAFLVLMGGGVLGLTPVETGLWGGRPLTIHLPLVGVSISIPLGVVLALGRRSRMPLVRGVSTLYIELVRGVPLITVLFVATFVLPLLLPTGVHLDPFWRIVIGLVLFQAAYMAETVRGGLQSVPRAQSEAATSLGLTWWQVQRSVVLPQALVAVIPAFVNNLLSTFMDTSLVAVVSMYDLTGSLRLALGDPRWRDFFIEGYLFVAAIYFGGSFAMSRYSLWLEQRLRGGTSR